MAKSEAERRAAATYRRSIKGKACRDRHKSKQRIAKLALVHDLKRAPCMDCGNCFPPECMDFDHVRGKKIASVSVMAESHRLSKMVAEIAKCELVCSNCHRTRTKTRLTSSD